jgi:TM2 domain-containing membrane protein YozV
MFERHKDPLISWARFFLRMLRSALCGIALITIALLIGMLGYHHFEHMSWLDAFVNAAMIRSGMGPLTELHSDGGKYFAGYYALFSGFTFAAALGLFFAPLAHRLLHAFHHASSKEKS